MGTPDIGALSRLRGGFIRYGSIAKTIAQELTLESTPDCKIGGGRVYLTFRNVGATRWSLEQQAEHALRAAAVARAVFARDHRAPVRRRVRRAIVVAYEDDSLVRGCAVTARWECIVPAG